MNEHQLLAAKVRFFTSMALAAVMCLVLAP